MNEEGVERIQTRKFRPKSESLLALSNVGGVSAAVQTNQVIMKLETPNEIHSPSSFFHRSAKGYGLNLQKNASVLYHEKGMRHVA